MIFAHVSTELRRKRVEHICCKSPKQLMQLLLPKLEPSPLRDEMNDTWDFWSEEKKKDIKAFRDETMKVGAEWARYSIKAHNGKNHSHTPETAGKAKRGNKRGWWSSEGPSATNSDAAVKLASSPCSQDGGNKKKSVKKGWKEKFLNPECNEIQPVVSCEKTSKEKKWNFSKSTEQTRPNAQS